MGMTVRPVHSAVPVESAGGRDGGGLTAPTQARDEQWTAGHPDHAGPVPLLRIGPWPSSGGR
jgi:hypothetical protein